MVGAFFWVDRPQLVTRDMLNRTTSMACFCLLLACRGGGGGSAGPTDVTGILDSGDSTSDGSGSLAESEESGSSESSSSTSSSGSTSETGTEESTSSDDGATTGGECTSEMRVEYNRCLGDASLQTNADTVACYQGCDEGDACANGICVLECDLDRIAGEEFRFCRMAYPECIPTDEWQACEDACVAANRGCLEGDGCEVPGEDCSPSLLNCRADCGAP